MAIVIVGVGNANFRDMDRLDGHGAMLYSNLSGKNAEADIVQFVSFNKYKDDAINFER